MDLGAPRVVNELDQQAMVSEFDFHWVPGVDWAVEQSGNAKAQNKPGIKFAFMKQPQMSQCLLTQEFYHNECLLFRGVMAKAQGCSKQVRTTAELFRTFGLIL